MEENKQQKRLGGWVIISVTQVDRPHKTSDKPHGEGKKTCLQYKCTVNSIVATSTCCGGEQSNRGGWVVG